MISEQQQEIAKKSNSYSTLWGLMIGVILGILICFWVAPLFGYDYFNTRPTNDYKEELKRSEVNAMVEKIEYDQRIKIVNLAMKNTGKKYITQDINFPLKPSWKTSKNYYRIGSLIDSNSGEDIIIIETKPGVIIGTGSNKMLFGEDSDDVKTYIIKKIGDLSYCSKMHTIIPPLAYNLLYKTAPECLTRCEKLQQLIIKGGKLLSKEDITKVDPTCK